MPYSLSPHKNRSIFKTLSSPCGSCTTSWASKTGPVIFRDQDRLTDVDKSVYKPAPTGPVKERLYDIIYADQHDKLTVAEIVGALGKPWHAQSISQLVVKYESEWLYKADKWSSLDQYMGSPNPSWDAEKARIEKLAWWGDLAGKQGIRADGQVWHLHAVAIVGEFSQSHQFKFTLDMMKRIFPAVASTKATEMQDIVDAMDYL